MARRTLDICLEERIFLERAAEAPVRPLASPRPAPAARTGRAAPAVRTVRTPPVRVSPPARTPSVREYKRLGSDETYS